MTNQPDWRFVENQGDADPINHGGRFLYVDATGLYSPEIEILDPPEPEPDFPYTGKGADPELGEETGAELDPEQIPERYKWTIHRFCVDPCTYQDGILSDNRFHPSHPAWFARPHDPVRPQDGPGGLQSMSSTFGLSPGDLVEMFISEDVRQRAQAWTMVGEHYGCFNLDSYPLHLTMGEVEGRYQGEIFIEQGRRRDPKIFRRVWSHHPRGGRVNGVAGDLRKGLYGPERPIAPSVEAAACGNGLFYPDEQIYLV